MLYLLPLVPVVFLGVVIVYKRVWLNRKIVVNCWFCNENCRVPATDRNKWTCCFCDQYNGFNSSGDYNVDIPAQRISKLNAVFHGRTKIKQEPDVTQFGSPNGLCVDCNKNQAIKYRQLANFIPTSEARFDKEMEEYKKRLENVYDLCAKCKKFLKNELYYQGEKFGFTAKLKHKLNRLRAKGKSALEQKTRTTGFHRKRRGNSGIITRVLQTTNVFVSFLLVVSDLHNLQKDSENEIVNLTVIIPVFVLVSLERLFYYSWIVCVCALIIHLLSLHLCKARLIMVDLLTAFVIVTMILLHFQFVHNLLCSWFNVDLADVYVWMTGNASFACMVATWVTVLPRKRIRKTKSKISGCFSILSSPGSSQDGSMISSLNKSLSPPSISPTSVYGLPSMCRSIPTESTRRSRETTPNRELGPKLNSLSLGTRQQARTGGPFGSLSFGASAYRTNHVSSENIFALKPLLAPSKFNFGSNRYSPPSSQFTSNIGAWNNVYPSSVADDARSVASSMLTSASQMRVIDHGQSMIQEESQKWWKILVLLALIGTLSTNVLVLYIVLTRN